VAAAAQMMLRQSYGNSGNLRQRQWQSGTFTVPCQFMIDSIA
jgi:hypothetical protein